MNHTARWPGNFGYVMNEVRTIVAHVTMGWPRRERVEEFVTQFIGPPDNPNVRPKRGIGTQYFISGDGTVFQTIDTPNVTWHGDHTNNWAIGVETGNLTHAEPPRPPGQVSLWRAMGPDSRLEANDIPGAKLWYSTFNHGETLVSWWATSTYNGPAAQPVGNTPRMLFTEWQYRSWALLARYLCEQFDLPRNFPLLPYTLRKDVINDPSAFRRIALADERFPVLVRALSEHDIVEAHFMELNQGHLLDHYREAIQPQNLALDPALAQRNDIWTALFGTYRGIHGHGFSGSNTMSWSTERQRWENNDHDCPGSLFDWHRFAREVWDWWWYPFDLSDNLSTVVWTRRPYQRANRNTPLLEYYFEGANFEAKNQAYVTRSQSQDGLTPQGIFDDVSSPSVFWLDSETPIYAPANGELVAARFPLPDPQHPVSLAFVLVRHEIFHRPNTLTIEIEGQGSVPAYPGRIDYNLRPGYIYSLVMHLGRPEGMSFDEVTGTNPDWLNRVLIRKKECDLGIALYNTPNHGGIPQSSWDSRPPGGSSAPLSRPTVLEGWRADQQELQMFLNDLRAGNVALASWSGRNMWASPINVILGDFLGESGVTRSERGNIQHGIALEVFSTGLVPPTFQMHTGSSGWVVPSGAVEPVALSYQSEWAKTPTAEERQRLKGIGVNPDLVPWWPRVAHAVSLDTRLRIEADLSPRGWAWHLRPLDFMRWINGVTWASEWPKYQVTDANGAEVPRPPRPRSRRV